MGMKSFFGVVESTDGINPVARTEDDKVVELCGANSIVQLGVGDAVQIHQIEPIGSCLFGSKHWTLA